ncbi:MAG: YgeY family selenium metabolism-linked hydrolase [Cloacibacillus porcorum]|uniref:YgeY family selenium metabolism-linked hydrolase n=1 Tax=Cloacibacillus porcorum TaxID=1197717 RepID=UPI0023F18ADD|nr:YgeY family selenium metabolism-linked hydrolase [Cloacibacillus porcorum]MCD7877916.1 YgeY family selenium metabolism-linked hydrolase [Cloacibacillus porcorum]
MSLSERLEKELIEFARQLVRLQSYSDNEGAVAEAVAAKMRELGYDEAFIDSTGNAVGFIGGGERLIHFDSHMDTVEVNDAEAWLLPPFAAEIKEGRLYGRGSVDMKSALAASVYGAALARELGYAKDKRICVSGSVCEEYCDGENIKMMYKELSLRPDFVVICEPSDKVITLGHKGKAQMRIRTHGLSAHGSAPEKGINAVYEMAEIIGRVEALNKRLTDEGSPHGTIVLSDISCVTASLNAVPSEAEIYLDLRLVLGETEEKVRAEMEELVRGKRASWETGTLRRTSWKGAPLVYEPLHMAWKLDEESPLFSAANAAYAETFGKAPERYDFWDFGTNAVTPVSMGIATIGFGPGEYKLAHMRDENCEVEKITDAAKFYAALIGRL